jgi:hypothetical protein
MRRQSMVWLQHARPSVQPSVDLMIGRPPLDSDPFAGWAEDAGPSAQLDMAIKTKNQRSPKKLLTRYYVGRNRLLQKS